MIRRIGAVALLLLWGNVPFAQAYLADPAAAHWADSVLGTMSRKQKIGQLLVVRASDPTRYYLDETEKAIRKYHVGGLCFFQGGPVRQAVLTNYFQQISKVPLFIAQDGEWGLGMRLDSVGSFPHQMMIGAVRDSDLVYRFARAVGQQCRRMGVDVDFAPDVDVNNNPGNPVINDRSFGENKYVVAEYGGIYAKALEAQGIIACAKHFPGHGDTRTDSHLDLPVIDKTMPQLDSLELYPFRAVTGEGVSSVMVAHLSIPSIDPREHRPTSLSQNNVDGLLRDSLGYRGLVFTDALGMKGVTNYFPNGQASVEALEAGNDVLCLPPDIPATLHAVRKAIRKKQMSWEDVDQKVRKVLMAKYSTGSADMEPVDTAHLSEDLNRQVEPIDREVAEEALTLVRRTTPALLPLVYRPGLKVAYVGIGAKGENTFARRLEDQYGADLYYFPYSDSTGETAGLLKRLDTGYGAIVVGVHGYSTRPAHNYGISPAALSLLHGLEALPQSVVFDFGNPYAIQYFPDLPNLVACYQDDSVIEDVAANMLEGELVPRGVLPVSVAPGLPAGTGILSAYKPLAMPLADPKTVGMDVDKLRKIDTLAEEAIAAHATPGCVVLVARNGKIVWDRAYGYLDYDWATKVETNTIYDLASVTKICATTVSVMKLVDEGKIDIQKTLGDYLPWMRGTNKENLKLIDIMLHQGGLKPDIPWDRYTTDAEGIPLPQYFRAQREPGFDLRVAEHLYIRNDYPDTMYQDIAQSELGPPNKYVYSDLDFILMGKIVETVTGMPLDQYANQTFYAPLGMSSTGFRPYQRFPLDRIAPTEDEKRFRLQLLHGDVHDPTAAIFGGVAGHAGLFSDAYDLSILLQMLLNGGTLNGERYIRDSTIHYFTQYHSEISRRGIGFDKPEKDNALRNEAYPCASASPSTFGHTGFTGTCIWVDPVYNLVFVFLSNRVCPEGQNPLLSRLNVRGNIQEAVYKAME